MKKIFVISLLIMTVLLGGLTIEAKSSKKKNKAKTTQTSKKEASLSIETFFSYNPEYNLYAYKSLQEIESSMKNLGYSKIGTESAGYKKDEDGSKSPMEKIGFQNGSTKVYIYKYKNDKWIIRIGVKFGSSTEKSSIIKAVNSKSKESNIGVRQEGNMVFLSASEH